MSNAVFPTLPGLMWDVKRTPTWSTNVQQAVGGKELRLSYYSYPLWKYTLSYELLRQTSGFQELQALAGFFNARQGKLDSFLFTDPEDNAVTGHGFGIGDGATAAFQLQRTQKGPVMDDNVSGVQPFVSTPRYNALQSSAAIGGTGWGFNSSGVGNPTVTLNAMIDPQGTTTATKIAYPNPTSGWSGIVQSLATVLGDGANVSGDTNLFSVWLRSDTPGQIISIILEDNPFTTGGSQLNITLTTNWVRYSILRTFPGGSANGANCHIRAINGITSGAVTVYAWGAQLEGGSSATLSSWTGLPTRYIPTTSGGLTWIPAYWPNAGDGFEPVYDVNTIAQIPQIINAGTPQIPLTNYSLNGAGLVTFVTPPVTGGFLQWTGSYYHRVRFDQDATEFNEFLNLLYEAKTITLVSVK